MRRAARKRRQPARRPNGTETLESRVLPATITVTSLADNTNASDSETTLREAIAQADSTRAADTIRFANGLSGVINIDSPLRVGNSDITIEGNGRSDTIIDGNGAPSIFRDEEFQATTTLRSLTLRDAQTAVEVRAFAETGGGAAGTFTIDDALITGTTFNAVEFRGLGYDNNYSFRSFPTARITNTTIRNNESRGVVFRLRQTAEIEDSVIEDNGGTGVFSGSSGGYDNFAPTATISGSVIRGNEGSGFINSTTSGPGGGIYHEAGPLTIVDSLITENQADDGAGIYSLESGNPGRIDLQLSRTTISNNTASRDGGGLFVSSEVQIRNSTISGNTAARKGGGILLEDMRETYSLNTSLDVANSTITNNQAATGGGFFQRRGDANSPPSSTVPMNFESSIIAGNTATQPSPDFGFGVESESSDVVLNNNFIGTNAGTLFSATGANTPDASGNFIGSTGSPIDPGLSELMNLGSQGVHVPLLNSPVLDRGSNPNNAATDQLGNDRTNGTADIGAVELVNAGNRIALSGTTLQINGTAADNVVSVEKVGGAIVATIDGLFASFPDTSVETIRVKGRGGDDLIEVRGATQKTLLDGNGGNDTIKGGPGQDTILGGSGNDNIRGTEGADFLNGGGGADLIRGQNGTDTLRGSDGRDTLIGGDANDVLFGDTGNDLLQGEEGRDILWGGVGDDRLEGGNERDTLFGEKGNDTLLGEAGDDYAVGNEGHDTLVGAAGNDTLFGGSGNDRVNGGNGTDFMRGNSGNDTMLGGSGSDVMMGDDGKDLLEGFEGRDIMAGGSGADSLYAGPGEDLLITGQILPASGTTFQLLTGNLRDEWVSDRTYDQRAINVRNGDGRSDDRLNDTYLIGQNRLTQNAFNDARTDDVRGGTGLDFFYATPDSDILDQTDPERFDKI